MMSTTRGTMFHQVISYNVSSYHPRVLKDVLNKLTEEHLYGLTEGHMLHQCIHILEDVHID